MNIIISGASGFIGTHLREHLLLINGINIYSLSREQKSFQNELSYEDFYENKLDCKVDFFIHLASPNNDYCSDSSINDGIVKLTKKILENLSYYKCTKFIFFSSAKVYGESHHKNDIFNENSKLAPMTDYSKAKAEAEFLIKKISKKAGIDYIIYRLPLVYGNKNKSNISKLTNLIDKSLPLALFNTKGFQQKSFLCIKNLNRIIMNNIQNPKTINNDIVNIADQNPISLYEFLLTYKKLSRSKSFIISLPKFMYVFFRRIPFIQTYVNKIFSNFVIENSKIKNILGVQLITTHEGIQTIVKK